MKKILRSGLIVEVDDEDAHFLNDYLIGTMKPRLANTRYVTVRDKVTRKYISLLHRMIMGVTDRSIIIDHENGNGLNCKRDNLRIATFSQNQWNRRRQTNITKGVDYIKRTRRWRLRFWKHNQIIFTRYFYTQEEAALCREELERIHYGEFNGLGTEQVMPWIKS